MAGGALTVGRKAIADLDAGAAASALTQSFQDYVVPMALDAASFETRFRAEDVDPCASHVYRIGGELAGIVLVARRGWTGRVAAMAVAPPWRGRGVGRTLLRAAMQDARERSDRRMLLEVIATNRRAIALYEQHGFARTRQLLGFRSSPSGKAGSGLAEVDPVVVARRMMCDRESDLPWQLAPETVLKAVAPTRGFALGESAFALVAPAKPGEASLRALYVPPEHRRRGAARGMLDALAGVFPDQAIVTPVAIPAALAPVFAAFQPIAITQYEMAIEIR